MKWYENNLRRNLVDMHIEDWDEEFLSQFDPKKYVELLKRANINSTMIYLLNFCIISYENIFRVKYLELKQI